MNAPALKRGLLLLLIGAYPFAMTFGIFAGLEPLDDRAVWRALAGSWIVTGLFYWAARFLIADRDARAIWLGIVLLVCSLYGFLGVNGLHIVGTSPFVALLYTAGAAMLSAAIVRPWRQKPRDVVPMILVGVALIGVNGYSVVERLWTRPASLGRSVVDQIVSSPPIQRFDPAEARDIFYIVFDGLGSPATLRDRYGLDAAGLVDRLRARGFFVADQARSNYSQTLLSFASFLNLGYLDPVVAAMGRDNPSWLPLADLIQGNTLMQLAKRAGHRIVTIGSDYGATKRFRQADECLCEQRGLDMFEQAVIDHTVLTALPLDAWTYGAHRRKIIEAFDALERAPAAPGRRLVLAHILAPHPPFIFEADGLPRRPDRPFTFAEGSDFQGSRDEYVQGYRDQARFLLKRLEGVIDAILNRAGPRPVIVIHGDHGPGSQLQQNDADATDMSERMNVFAAYYFPDRTPQLYPSITPVNGARALANLYLGTDLPPLPDLSWFSTAARPYDLTIVK